MKQEEIDKSLGAALYGTKEVGSLRLKDGRSFFRVFIHNKHEVNGNVLILEAIVNDGQEVKFTNIEVEEIKVL